MRDRAGVETAVVDDVLAGIVPVSSLPNAELVIAFDEVAARRRAMDAVLVAMAGEVAARSEGLPAEDSLVRAAGHRSVREMVQQRVGVRAREAGVLCAVAEATRARVAVSGGDVPARFPHVGAAVAAGWIAVAQAHAIVETLSQSTARLDDADLDIAERSLVEHASGASPDDLAPMVPEDLATLARRWVDHLDPDGEEPRYEERLAQRYFRMRIRRDGMVRGEFLAMPEQGEAIATVLDAEAKPRRVTFDDACGDGGDRGRDADGPPIDGRSRDQRCMDAIAAMAGHHAASEAPRICDEAPTLTITVSAEALHGRPSTLDDVPRLQRTGEPVPVSLAASLLCDAAVQVVVHDGDGEPLRQGRRQRLFTRSQRRAIIARDRHCRAPGCSAPAGWCESHHVEWWSRGGATDVDNGILLCRFHHTEVHRGTLTIERAADSTSRWRVATSHPRRPRTRPPMRR